MSLDPGSLQFLHQRADPDAETAGDYHRMPAERLFSPHVTRAQRFHLNLDPWPPERLTVVCGGCEHCTSEYEATHRNGTPYTTIEFVAQGLGSLSIAGRSYALAPGMLFVHGPRVPLHIAADPAVPLVKYFVCLAGVQASALLERYGPALGEVTHTAAPADVRDLFDELIRTSLRETELAPRIAAVVLERLVLRVAETSVRRKQAASVAFETYLRCRDHLEQRWSEISSLGQLARECGVDPGYVCRLFRRFDQQTPYQYLLHQRMKHAADRLTEKGASVKQVADDLGFRDPFHFSRVFRKVMGLPPGRFARLYNQAHLRFAMPRMANDKSQPTGV